MDKHLKEMNARFEAEKMNARAAAVNAGILDEENRSIRTVLATETPSMVWDWNKGMVREILLITKKAVNIPDDLQIPLLDSHYRYSIDELYGSMRNLRIEDNELVAETVFSSLAEDAYTNAREGHLNSVSVGYQTFSEKTLVIAPGETGKIEGRKFENNYGDDRVLVIRTNWTPKEGSLVVVGADENATFRSAAAPLDPEIKEDKIEILKRELTDKIDMQEKSLNSKINNIQIKGVSSMKEEEKTADQIRKDERERSTAIQEYGKRFDGKFTDSAEKTTEAVREGWDINKFREHVLDNLTNSQAVEKPASELGLSREETERFSIRKAILATSENNWEGASFEQRVIADVEKATGRISSERGFRLPFEVQKRSVDELLKRTLTTSVAASGGNIVGDDYRGQDYIEALRSQLVLGRSGITMLAGLTEDITLPKQLTDPTISMQAEATAPSETAITFSQLTGSPETATANVGFSRKLLIQGDPSVDGIIQSSLQAQMNIKKDYMGLHGDGVSPNPEGIASTTGIGTVDMSTPTWKKIVEFESDVESADAVFSSANWITNPGVKGAMKTVLKATSTAVFLMNEQNEMNGYPSHFSTLVAAQNLFFGYWSQLVLLMWGNQEIIVDPYTQATAGIIKTTILEEFDYLVRNPKSFSLATNVALT